MASGSDFLLEKKRVVDLPHLPFFPLAQCVTSRENSLVPNRTFRVLRKQN